LAADGRKMSKRLKNYTAPDILMEKFGADALRLFLINSGLVKAEELRFTDDGVKDMVRRALLPWFNSYKFFQTYAQVDGWNPKEHFKHGDNILDRWVLSKLQTLIKNVHKEMEAYRLYNVVPTLFTFIEDLTNWYIRLNRRRFWQKGLSDDKKAAYTTLYTTVKTVGTVMAPFTPFLSEYIFLELKKFGGISEESVHLCNYPKADEKLINSTLEDAVERMQQIILLGRQKRNQVQIKVKTPLQSLAIVNKNQVLLDEVQKLEQYIQTELNVKEILYSCEEDKFIKLFAKPNAPVLGKRLGKKFGPIRKKIEALDPKTLSEVEMGATVELDGETLTGEDLLIMREAKPGTQAISNRWIAIDLDCNLTDELIAEGLAREVVNRIQRTRKDLDFNVADRIVVQFTGDRKIVDAINKHKDYIAGETLANKLENVSDIEGQVLKVDDQKLKLYISKV
ncbi:MAG: DUF5915 domain-containing protein, partial [Bacteriovoracia bacterium]